MQLYPTVQNREPTGSQCHEVVTADRIRLRAITIIPKNSAKGTVVVLNGRTEFVERYFETFNDLTKRGFAVASFDWRGQGGSQRLLKNPMRGYVNSFADYDKDLSAIMEWPCAAVRCRWGYARRTGCSAPSESCAVRPGCT